MERVDVSELEIKDNYGEEKKFVKIRKGIKVYIKVMGINKEKKYYMENERLEKERLKEKKKKGTKKLK
jgi:hypothetical protein